MSAPDPYYKLRPVPTTPEEELCTCLKLSSLVLQPHLTANPITCVACGLEVPPERAGISAELADRVAQWLGFHDAFYTLWLDSGEFESWAREHLEDIAVPSIRAASSSHAASILSGVAITGCSKILVSMTLSRCLPARSAPESYPSLVVGKLARVAPLSSLISCVSCHPHNEQMQRTRIMHTTANWGRILHPDITAGLARLASFRQRLGVGEGPALMSISRERLTDPFIS